MLIVQSDLTVLLETGHAQYPAVRAYLSQFAELVKSPEYVQTYQINALSLWNAAAAGRDPSELLRFLEERSRYPLPAVVEEQIRTLMGRYGLIKLESCGSGIRLNAADPALLQRLVQKKPVAGCLKPSGRSGEGVLVREDCRGLIKQELARLGYPVEDTVGFKPGSALEIRLREVTASGADFRLRRYQQQAVDAFCGNRLNGGSGLVVLPCGAGKTVTAVAVMAELNCETLILTPHATSARQWKQEILDKTYTKPELIGEYCGSRREIRPITIATYQMLTHRQGSAGPGEYPHMELFGKRDWGLIIYDEVHLLPAPVFRMTADLQATRRLGLTATLVREDGRAKDVFTLIGPKCHEAAWKDLEEEGWIASAQCREIRLPMPETTRLRYNAAPKRNKHRIAGENPAKIAEALALVEKHREDAVLVIGQYLSQLDDIAQALDAPVITGRMPNAEREAVYGQFRRGEIRRLVVSKVANFAVDLPDASVAIQLSGSFGSRQEEAQRLGRILRPKSSGQPAVFYSLVSKDCCEQDFAWKRQLFLLEQGYRYEITEKAEAEEWALETN